MNQQSPASWQDLMAFAFGVLKLTPDVFWAMTPREFDAAARPFIRPDSTTGRGTLMALMREYPDQ
jgi:uncharacterized phage protein (TIGR02216 family)